MAIITKAHEHKISIAKFNGLNWTGAGCAINYSVYTSHRQ